LIFFALLHFCREQWRSNLELIAASSEKPCTSVGLELVHFGMQAWGGGTGRQAGTWKRLVGAGFGAFCLRHHLKLTFTYLKRCCSNWFHFSSPGTWPVCNWEKTFFYCLALKYHF
jgi:hypothetical protein